MKDFVIYTVLTGGYDDVLQPRVVDERFDYVLFSNDIKDGEAGIWSIRPIPPVVNDGGKRLSRYPKTHPETLLADYKASLYIDANIQIMDQWVYDRFVELYGQNTEYAGVKLVLTGRDCIYEHSFDMVQALLEHDYAAIRQCHELYKRGFPRHFGLNENNVIFRIHTERMREVDEQWWWWICNYSSRDQFSLMYCLWKNGIALNYFLPQGEDARNGEHFRLVNHDGRASVIKTKVIKRGFVERLRVKSKTFNPDRHLSNWLRFYKFSCPVLALRADGLLSITTNLFNLLKCAIKKKRG